MHLRGRQRDQRQRVNQVPDPLRDYLPEQLSLVLGVQVYHELRERVQVRNVHQNPRKLLLQTTREERSIRRLRKGQVGYVEDENEAVDRELDDFGIANGAFLAAWQDALGIYWRDDRAAWHRSVDYEDVGKAWRSWGD